MAGENVQLRCALVAAQTQKVTVGTDRTKGDVWVLNDLVVFALDDVDSGDPIGVCHGAERALFPKTAGLAINPGDRVYWNDATKLVTKTASQRAIGWGIARPDDDTVAGATGDSDVYMEFHQELESSTY